MGAALQLFLPEKDFDKNREQVDLALRERLPPSFRGWPTSFGPPDEEGVRLLQQRENGPVDHLIEIVTLRGYLSNYLGIDPFLELSPQDWLVLEEHRLRAVTGGRVFYDGLGALVPLRQKLSFYPHDLWLYLMAAEWMKIDQEEPFVGRTGDVGDDLGSRIIAARLAQALMRLAFLQERQYPPYSKWLGTAFLRLECAAELAPHLKSALTAATWIERQEGIFRSAAWLAERHNRLGITPPLDTSIRHFHGRPYLVLASGRFAGSLMDAVQDERIRALPSYAGSLNQFIISVNVLDSPELCNKLKQIYE